MRFKIYLFLILISFFGGCATTPPNPITSEYPEPDKLGVYHKVKHSQTIWSIAKGYNVSIGDIINSNNIPNAARVEEGQLIFIPGATTAKEIEILPQDNQGDFIWPLKGKVLSYFHDRDEGRVNKGIDIQGQEGEIVKAARAGEVIFADQLVGYGATVIIDHKDGYNSVYAQNKKLMVNLGDHVNQGSDVAQLDDSNKASFLHFEIRKNSVEDNPFYYLP